jgi:hypothetical protein
MAAREYEEKPQSLKGRDSALPATKTKLTHYAAPLGVAIEECFEYYPAASVPV